MNCRNLKAYVLLSALCQCAISAAARADEAQRPVTIDDHFTLANLGAAVISPSGDKIAYTESRWQEATNDRKSEIWVVATDGKTPPERLTFEPAGYGSPTWSPDGSSLYFTWSRRRAGATAAPYDGTNQVWRIKATGGEPVAVTQVKDGIDSFELASDGKSAIYTTSSSKFTGDWSKLRTQFDDVRYGEAKSVQTEIWRLDLSSWRSEKLLDFDGNVDSFALTRAGDRLAMITAPNARTITIEGQTQVTIVDLKTAEHYNLPDDLWRKQAPSPYGRLFSPRWSADGKALTFANTVDGYPNELYLATWDASDKPLTTKLPRPRGVSLDGGVEGAPHIAWIGDTHDLCFLGEEKARVRAYVLRDATGKKEQAGTITPGDIVIEALTLDSAGKRLGTVVSSPKAMPDVHIIEDSKLTKLTDINPQTATWKLPVISVVSWKGASGKTVEGILELPPDYKPGDRVPAYIKIHGGPTSCTPNRMIYDIYGSVLFPSQGIAVLSPNYRGSTSYGDDFITDLIGHENEVDVEDILTGVEHMVAQGIFDDKRIGIGGWSNGGYLTNCCIAKTKRFAAASSGAGIADMTLEWGTNDEPAYQLVFCRGTIWDKADVYRRFSPIYEFNRVTTPVIFHVGAEDRRCPPGNSLMGYRALKETLGKTAELVVYPGAPHGLGTYKDRKAKLAWDLVWFQHYLQGKAVPTN